MHSDKVYINPVVDKAYLDSFLESKNTISDNADGILMLLNDAYPIEGYEYNMHCVKITEKIVLFKGHQNWCDGETFEYEIPLTYLYNDEELKKGIERQHELAKKELDNKKKEEERIVNEEKRLMRKLNEKYGINQ